MYVVIFYRKPGRPKTILPLFKPYDVAATEPWHLWCARRLAQSIGSTFKYLVMEYDNSAIYTAFPDRGGWPLYEDAARKK